MLSREVNHDENQRFPMNSTNSTRQMNNKTQGIELGIHNNPNSHSSTLIQGMPNSTAPQTSTQTTGSMYNGFYGTSGFNSTINNFEASLQWLTDRMPNNTLLDKGLNCNSNPPSHSCCMNRIGEVGIQNNIGMCSPLSGDSYRTNRDPYQTKPPSLSVNVIDSVQSWFNLQPLPNQQYGSKFSDQNCSQMNLPILEQSDLKQNDICLQIPDTYFEQSVNNSSSNNKQMIGNLNEINTTKIPEISDSSKTQNGYQSTNILPRDWKQPLQTNYISSPTLYTTLGDSPDHYLYSLPPTTTSYCMMTDNVGITGKLQSCVQSDKQQNNSRIGLPYIDPPNQIKPLNPREDKSLYEKTDSLRRMNDSFKMTHNDASTHSCNQDMKSSRKYPETEPLGHYSSSYMPSTTHVHERMETKMTDVQKDSTTRDLNDETTSGSDESNIIVEESDETEEIDSVISIEEMKKTFMNEEPVELRCLVCNVKSSVQTPATQFIHMNDSFPLTSASKMPVASKLIQILPSDLLHFLKLHNSFMCRRCLNLIETIEVLEVKLTSVKQTLSENFSKTVQYFLPATPILEIENGKAKIIDKEIIPCIEKVNEIQDGDNVCTSGYGKKDGNMSSAKDCMENNETEDEMEDDETEEEEESESSVDDKATDNSEEVRQCNICTKILSNVKSYKKHMQLHTKCFSFYCEYCGKGFNLKHSLEKHLLLHKSDSRYQCEKCGKTYTQKHRLEDHLRRHSGDFRFKCDECGKGFMQKATLEVHMRSHTKEQPFICELCGSRFVKESNLKAHLQICKKEEVKCGLCSETFQSKTYLKKHEVAIHGANPSVECTVCGKILVNVKDLKPHMRSHSQDRPYECKICGKSYKSISNLNQHAKVHDESKLFKCSLCGEGFCRRKTLDDHMNKHTGERVYKCNECGKGFFDQKNLQKHVKLHSGTLNMKACSICDKKFHHGLEVHMRTHSGVRPYVCSHCGQAFTVNSTLTRHIQSKHQKVLES